jgi:Uma2 family endonuclease
MTFADYVNYTAPSGMRDELLHGEIILSPSPKVPHQDLCVHLYELLKSAVRPEFVVRLDTTINLKGWDGEEGPRPDVFVIDRKRWAEASESGGYPIGSPPLIVEVRAPSNDRAEFEKKAALFLADGGLAVWIVEIQDRCVISHAKSGPSQWLSGTLVDLPGELSKIKHGSISVSEIFEGIIQ